MRRKIEFVLDLIYLAAVAYCFYYALQLSTVFFIGRLTQVSAMLLVFSIYLAVDFYKTVKKMPKVFKRHLN